NGDALAYDVVADLYPATGNTYAVGITGPPGVGKSSLISALIRHVRDGGTTIGVVSVDPSSPFSQGALLGDRIRLADHFLDPGVFIRSMGTRGHLGGLAEATLQALLVLDAAGKEIVFLETVGAGCSTRCSAASSIRSAPCGRYSRRSSESMGPKLTDIEAARARLDGVARVTPVYGSETLSRLLGRDVRLKAENLQRTGSFKV